MVNPNSTLYMEHPDWVLHAGKHARTLTRSELVLNLGLPEVQEYIINFVSAILDTSDVTYIKWDNNRGIHEMSHPSDNYDYMLGIYHVIDTLTTKYPDILWEGCASGGGRFDAGLLHYWPQHWTSDNTDASDRLTIQLGTSLAYPPSAMGCHVSVVPNHLTNRNVSIEYRAHVALRVIPLSSEPTSRQKLTYNSSAAPSVSN
jgi:alpha-galactosidase